MLNLVEYPGIAERPIGIQLFGADPDHMAEAAAIVAMRNPDFIDLNFGCPVKKVVSKNGGASILKDIELLEMIVRKVTASVDLPVTLKYRSGWDDQHIVTTEVAHIAESNGISAVCLHPRTRTAGFTGSANWDHIKQVKDLVSIPVIGSGDVVSPETGKKMFDQTGCDAIMICRASFGNPWIFNQVKHYLATGETLPGPSIEERIRVALSHLRLSIEKNGQLNGLVRMRSKLCWYIKGLPGVAKLRAELVRLPEEKDVINLFDRYTKRVRESGCEEKIAR